MIKTAEEAQDLFDSYFQIASSIAHLYKKIIRDDSHTKEIIANIKIAKEYEDQLVQQIYNEVNFQDAIDYIGIPNQNSFVDETMDANARLYYRLCDLIHSEPVQETKVKALFGNAFSMDDMLSSKLYSINDYLFSQNAMSIYAYKVENEDCPTYFKSTIYNYIYHYPYLEEMFLENGKVKPSLASKKDILYYSLKYNIPYNTIYDNMEIQGKSNISEYVKYIYETSNNNDYYYNASKYIDLEGLLLMLTPHTLNEVYDQVMSDYLLNSDNPSFNNQLSKSFQNIVNYINTTYRGFLPARTLTKQIEFQK